jgi:hypothetical protein
MLSPRFLLLTCLLFSCISSHVIPEPQTDASQDQERQSDLESFQKLLEQVDLPALHAALHAYTPKKFKHGVFQEDRTAVELVHKDEPTLASSILAVAKLAKRQDGGNATSTATVAIDSTVTESINPSTVGPNPVESTGLPAGTSKVTPEPQSPSPSAVGPATATVTSTEGVVPTNTASVSLPIAPGPISIPSHSSGAVITTTNAAGVTIITTINGGVITLSEPSAAPSFTSVVVQTETLPNGGQSTITTITVLHATATAIVTPSGSAGAGTAATSTAPSAGLQTGLAPRTRGWGWEAVGVLGGAVGFAMVL